MPDPLLVATTNRDKLREIHDILGSLPYTLIALSDLPPVAPPDESGSTFIENARLKSLYYGGPAGVLTIAEDSGLEVDALDGAPGVYSARYGEPAAATYPQKFALLYRSLAERGAATSTARFTCAVAIAEGGQVLFETCGAVEGWIAPEPRGQEGFGYDPIFFYPPFNKTLGEITRELKATVSHRGQAFRRVREYLASKDSAAGGHRGRPPGVGGGY
jgi:XTP/dITP diphosphohydrolase